MKKKQLIKNVSRKSGVSLAHTSMILDNFISIIQSEVCELGQLQLSKFGRFFKANIKPRKHYNIKLQKVVLSKAKTTVKFKPYFLLDNTKQKSFSDSGSSKGINIIMPGLGHTSLELTSESILKECISDPKACDKREKTTHSHPSPKHSQTINYTTFSGNRILPNSLNLGNRVASLSREESSVLEYVGIVSNGSDCSSFVEVDSYPKILCPVNGTKILNFQTFGGITGGITEPLLYHALLSLHEIEPEIEILQNISIPIKSRNYGYKPDIAIIWKKHNFYLDIEIDEPYDIVSRKPIHYKKCSDAIRNSYIVENGWFIVRFAEEYVAKNVNICKDFVSLMIFSFLHDERFHCKLGINSIDRWTYDEAKKMASENYRESYLGIVPNCNSSSDSNVDNEYCSPKSFEFVKPADDIFEDTYEDLKSRILRCSKDGSYIYLKQKGTGYEYVTRHGQFSFTVKDFRPSVKLYDVIEGKDCYILLCDVDDFWSSNNIIKETSPEDWEKTIFDCIVNCNPIKIDYNKGYQGIITSRTVLYLSRWYQGYDEESRSKYSAMDLIKGYATFNFKSAIEDKSYYHFSGYCLYRQDLRTFSSDRITSGCVYNCYKPAIPYENKHIWEMLEEGAGDIAELIYSHFPSAKKDNLLYIGNYCNALVMQGKLDEALSTYLRFKPTEIVLELNRTLAEACLDDIEHFSQMDSCKQYFQDIRRRLEANHWLS